jgi:hypothetical protein
MNRSDGEEALLYTSTIYSFVLIQAICLNRGNVRDTIAVEMPLVQGIEKDYFAMTADEIVRRCA